MDTPFKIHPANYLLLFAVANNKVDLARRAIKEGADVNRLIMDLAPLHHAVVRGYLQIVQLLIEHGADVSQKGERHVTPMELACGRHTKNTYDMCKLLVEKGANCNEPTPDRTPFLKAVEVQPLEVIEFLVNHGADLTARSRSGATALHCAAQNPYEGVFEFLLDRGMDIEDCDELGRSVLFYAIYNGNSEACEILLRRGAAVNRESDEQLTPLAEAVWPDASVTGQDPRVEMLLEYGAEVTRRVLELAAPEGGSCEIRSALVRRMAELEFLNISIIPEDQRQILDNHDCYTKCYRACLQEFKDMEMTKLYDNVSVINILMDNETVLARYAKNNELTKVLAEEDYNDKFPIYFARLKGRFCAAVRAERLLKAASEILCQLFVLNDPSHLVIHNILRFLDVGDLTILCPNSVTPSF